MFWLTRPALRVGHRDRKFNAMSDFMPTAAKRLTTKESVPSRVEISLTRSWSLNPADYGDAGSIDRVCVLSLILADRDKVVRECGFRTTSSSNWL